MSADRSSSAAHAALSQRIEAIERDMEALGIALKKARHSRLLLLVLLAPFVLVFAFLFLNLGKQFTEEAKQKDLARFALNEFFELQQAEASQEEDWDQMLSRYQELLLTEIENLGKNSMPVVEAAFRKQIEQDTGKFTTMFNDQRDLLVSNLQARAEPLVQERYQQLINQHEHILREEFDRFGEDEKHRMLVNLNAAMDQLLQKYYIEEIERQLNALYETYDHFPVADPVGDLSNEQLLLGAFMETLQVKVAGDPVIAEVNGASPGGETESTGVADDESVPEEERGTEAEEAEESPEDNSQENNE